MDEYIRPCQEIHAWCWYWTIYAKKNHVTHFGANTVKAVASIASNTVVAISGLYSQSVGKIGKITTERKVVNNKTSQNRINKKIEEKYMKQYQKATKTFLKLITHSILVLNKNLRIYMKVLENQRHKLFRIRKPQQNINNLEKVKLIIYKSEQRGKMFVNESQIMINQHQLKNFSNLGLVKREMDNILKEINIYYNSIFSEIKKYDKV